MQEIKALSPGCPWLAKQLYYWKLLLSFSAAAVGSPHEDKQADVETTLEFCVANAHGRKSQLHSMLRDRGGRVALACCSLRAR